MSQPLRLDEGGRLDRSRSLGFRFDGRSYQGYAGDTLASALLANGVRLVGRSFKYHRPRGIFSIGAEEPNALVSLGVDRHAEPNTRATQVELRDGVEAFSQNCWPGLRWDLMSLNNLFSALLPAGFYYKTFMAPRRLWPWYERAIRRAAGMGRAPRGSDPDHYLACYAHCDVLVVGAGPAGLCAASAAAAQGARVLLVDEQFQPGGWLCREQVEVDGLPGADWAAALDGELAGRPRVRVLRRTTAFGYYDHNMVALVEHLPPGAQHDPSLPRQRLWRVFARQVVLATGAIERPLVFANNDRPGIMLAGAARGYLNQFAVRAGRRAVIYTNNDSAYLTARDLADRGIAVAALIDTRDQVSEATLAIARERGISVDTGYAVHDTRGRRSLSAVRVGPREQPGGRSWIDCDLLCVSGGWMPAVHLHAQSGGKPVYSPQAEAFVPGPCKQAERSAGAARGVFDLAGCLADGERAGAEAARQAGFSGRAVGRTPPRAAIAPGEELSQDAFWAAPRPGPRSKQFVDLQDDVTTLDLEVAHREGYVSVEHLKRYTTLGMGTDQGKTSNINGMTLLAGLRGEPLSRVGTTTFRPPYTPVTLGALAGGEVGPRVKPTRLTALHAQHQQAGAVFAPLGLWLRPQAYPRRGESLHQAAQREARAVRAAVGCTDVSTLGKLEVHGPDAGQFLDRIYANQPGTLPPGRCRYGLMLREDGMIFDDGTVSRLDEQRFFLTTTSGNAGAVLQHLEFYRDVVWPELELNLFDVTEQWAALAVAGPASRGVVQALAPSLELAPESFGHMHWREATLSTPAGVPARILRVSFSGEMAFEIYLPARHAAALWQAILALPEPLGVTPYGMDALEILRVEKGYIGLGAEADGRTTPQDLGLGALVSRRKDFVGKAALHRPGLTAGHRLRLTGLLASEPGAALPEGAQVIPTADASGPGCSIGHVSSAVHSVALGRAIGLALVRADVLRDRQTVFVADPVRGNAPIEARLVAPCFHDPEGQRLHG